MPISLAKGQKVSLSKIVLKDKAFVGIKKSDKK